MKLRSLIALLNIVILVVTVAVILPVFLGMIKQQETRAINDARTSLMTQTKIRLKDIVDSVYCLIQERHDSINDRERMIAKYGAPLRSWVAVIERFAECHPREPAGGIPDLEQLKRYLPCEIVPILLTKGDGSEETRFIVDAAADHEEGFIFNPQHELSLIFFKRTAKDKMIAAAGVPRKVLADRVQREIADIARKFFFDSGAGYIFVIYSDQRFVVYPPVPDFENRYLTTIPEFENQTFIADWLEICNSRGQGFVRYAWLKPLSFEPHKKYPKLSFVRKFEPWRWIIGAGEYLDGFIMAERLHIVENQAAIKATMTKILFVASIVISIMIMLTAVFAGTISRPISKLINHMKKVRADELPQASIVLKGSREIRELGRIFNKTLKTVNSGVKKIQDTVGAKERIRSELKIVQEMQRCLLPNLSPQSPQTKEFDIQAAIQPGRPVGGDFYDFFFIDGNHFCIAVGDVAGKGVSATLLGVISRALLRAKAVKGLQSGEIVSEINRELCLVGSDELSVQLFLAILNPSNGNLFYTNAGCTPSYLIRNNHAVESLPVVHGEPLGKVPDMRYDEELISLRRGERLVLCTNGMIKAENFTGEQYGAARFQESLKGCADADASQTVDKLLLELGNFTGNTGFKDDVAVLTLRFNRNKK